MPRAMLGDNTHRIISASQQSWMWSSHFIQQESELQVCNAYESRTVKKAECQRIDAFELWCWRRLLRVPWTARDQPVRPKGNQSWMFFGRKTLKLKLQYFGHLMQRVDSLEILWCWEGLGAGGEGDDRGWDCWMASPTQWTWVWVNSGSWWWTGRPGMLQFMGSQRVAHDWATKLNWSNPGVP